MNKQQLYKELGSMDEDLIQEAAELKQYHTKNNIWIKVVSVAAVFAIMIGIGSSMLKSRNDINLIQSIGNVKVSYINKVPNVTTSDQLIDLSERELFEKYDTVLFKGEITEIKNIIINFNGSKDYRAIAKIKVEKIYRGLIHEEDIISVLLPCPIDSNVWVEDTEIVSAMRVGMTGVFMPITYDENSIREENGTKLYLKDLADFGLLDGERYAFLETKNGLIFSKWAYKSIENAKTLDEIEEYINKMIVTP